MKDLGLNRVKIQEIIQLLVVGIVQSRHRKRMKIQQLCMRWVDLWQNQMLERDGYHCFCMKPSIREGTNKILRRKRLKDRNSESKILWFFAYNLQYNTLAIILTTNTQNAVPILAHKTLQCYTQQHRFELVTRCITTLSQYQVLT